MDKHFDINEEGCSIRCKLYRADAGAVRRVVVFCHGFGGRKDNRAAEDFAHRICAKWKGSAVVAFDWPCHGEDARKNLTLADCDEYLRLVVSDARVRFGTGDLYAFGTSFGGYLLLKYLAEHGNPFRKVALRCPAIDLRRTLLDAVAREGGTQKLEAGHAVLVGYDRKVKVTRAFFDDIVAHDVRSYEYFDYADDILIVHGTADEAVPCADSAAFADSNVIEFVPVEGADHRFHDPKKMDAANARIIAFFESAERG